jgi:thiol-disulfide isomerase/thioredoxin
MKDLRRIGVCASALAMCLVLGGELGATPVLASAPPFQPISSSLQRQLSTVPLSVFDAVGVSSPAAPLNPPFLINKSPLMAGSKTIVFFFGAEFCPYCAAERWALTIALDRFGKLTGLGNLASSSQDVFPSTPTMSYAKVKYSSKYVVLQSREYESSSGTIFQKLTKFQTRLVDTYDAAPYVKDVSPGEHPFPFVDLGNKALVSGADYTPGLLSGLSRSQIAARLNDPRNPVTQAIVASANYLSAAICLAIGDRAPVCGTKGVSAAMNALTLQGGTVA